ncbi:MAG: hypothetical protein O3A46_17550, partial [Candidatus Poribacteria bacterium]|nr:hypothetical protein [Candidatus Poribacteria bacterium]
SNAPLPAMVEAQIMNRCGGNPLFISETMTAMEHRGDITFDEFTTAMPLPSKIEELITDRVAILPLDVRRCLSIAAVIGSFVRVDLLDALYGDSTVSLDSCLYELLRRDILMELDVYPVALFRFVHDAVQEAVYRSLSPSDRQRLHGRIGDVIDRAPTVSSEQIQMAAFHYAHSTNTEKATYYLMESAERERREFNLVRSYALLKQALSLTTSEEVGRRNILRRASILECAGDAAMHVGFHRDAAESFRDAANAFDMMAFRPTHGAWLRYRRADQGLGSQAGGAPLGWAYRKDSGGRCSSGKTSLSTRARESGLSRRVQTGRTAP